jgi:hypothetical protein
VIFLHCQSRPENQTLESFSALQHGLRDCRRFQERVAPPSLQKTLISTAAKAVVDGVVQKTSRR